MLEFILLIASLFGYGPDIFDWAKQGSLTTDGFNEKIITKNKLTRERRKGVKSKFKKYFDTLPEEFSVPLTMSEEEFQLLPQFFSFEKIYCLKCFHCSTNEYSSD